MFPEQNSLPLSRPDSNTLAFSKRLPMECTTELWELHVGKLVLRLPPSAAASPPARDFRAEEPLLSHGPSEALLGGGLRGAGPHTPAGAWPPFLAADASVSDWQPAVN